MSKGRAGVRYMSVATVWVNLVARTGDTGRFRVRPRVSHKFQAGGRAWASIRAMVKFRFKACVSVMAWARLRVRVRIMFRFRVKVRINARFRVKASFKAGVTSG